MGTTIMVMILSIALQFGTQKPIITNDVVSLQAYSNVAETIQPALDINTLNSKNVTLRMSQ